MKWFRFPLRSTAKTPESFDLFDRRAVAEIDRQRNSSLGRWNPADAETSVEGAAKVVLGLLRDRRRIRRQFPRAISAGSSGGYAQWLARDGGELGLSSAARANIAGAFDASFGKRIRDFYLHSPELQAKFPHGLLPIGQVGLVKWLLREGREKHGLAEIETLWFLHETAEQIPEMVALTWLINPRWQERQPRGLTSCGGRDFTRWLRTEYGLRVSEACLPSPARNAPIRPGVNLLSHFCYPSGIRQAAMNIRGALESAGWSASARDVPTSPRTDVLEREPFLGLEIFPTTILNVAPAPHSHDAYERSGLLRRPDVRRIAYWAWELDQIPERWTKLAPLLHEIWAPTAFVADAFRKRMPLPVHEVLPGLELGEITPVSRASLGIPEENYLFLFMFDMSSEIERKNPLAVMRAFAAAFPKRRDVSLIIKVARGETKPSALALLQKEAELTGAHLIDAVFPHAQAYGLLQACDCFVSLHRSEGFGLCLAEAMLLGKPVIATNYSGNLSFMNAQNSLLVDYALTEILEDLPAYQKGNRWAEPSFEHAVAQLRYCEENRSAAAALGAVGQAEMRAKFSLKAAGERMVARLRDSAVA